MVAAYATTITQTIGVILFCFLFKPPHCTDLSTNQLSLNQNLKYSIFCQSSYFFLKHWATKLQAQKNFWELQLSLEILYDLLILQMCSAGQQQDQIRNQGFWFKCSFIFASLAYLRNKILNCKLQDASVILLNPKTSNLEKILKITLIV